MYGIPLVYIHTTVRTWKTTVPMYIHLGYMYTIKSVLVYTKHSTNGILLVCFNCLPL